MGEQLSPGRRACMSWGRRSSVSLFAAASQPLLPRCRCEDEAAADNQLTVLQHQKNLGSYADKCIYSYSSTFVSLKMLIYSEIHIKPLKTLLFTLFKNEKYSFFCHSLSKFFPSHPLHFVHLVIDSNHKTKKQHVNKLLPRKVKT